MTQRFYYTLLLSAALALPTGAHAAQEGNRADVTTYDSLSGTLRSNDVIESEPQAGAGSDNEAQASGSLSNTTVNPDIEADVNADIESSTGVNPGSDAVGASGSSSMGATGGVDLSVGGGGLR